MKLHILGTGHAMTFTNYNTCFVIEENGQYMLVDAGGGNRIITRLTEAEIDVGKIDYAFCTHNHTDHLLGFAWIVRLNYHAFKAGLKEKPFTIFASHECVSAIKTLAKITLGEKAYDSVIDTKILFKEVKNGEKTQIMGLNFQFFDTFAVDMPQMGFYIEDKDLLFCGDVPLNETYFERFKNVKYLCLEALCSEMELKVGALPNKHFPVKKSAQTAQSLHAQNLILWHTADRLPNRQEVYLEEARSVYDGNVIVPKDLDVIEIE